MAITLTTSQYNAIVAAANFMLAAQAHEEPFDANVIDRLAPVAAAIGFVPPLQRSATAGAFKEAALNNPFSTLISLVAFVGHP